MSGLKTLVLLLVVGGLAVFFLQNWSPVLPLVFFGSQTLELPLALWMLFFTAAGVATSAIVQLLHYAGRSPSTKKKLRRESGYSTASRTKFEAQTNPRFQTQTPPQSDWDTPVDPEWGSSTKEADEWEIEEPPVRETRPRITLEKDSEAQDSVVREDKIPNESTDMSRSDSSYAYGYSNPEDTGVGRTEKVYDAQYRMIRPPYRNSSSASAEDEEDWGFEDEELSDNR